METPKGNFYLLKSVDENGKDIYAQNWNNGIVRDSLSISHWAEICYRSLNLIDTLKLRVLIEVFDNFMNKYPWEVVEYEMPLEQYACNEPKEKANWVDVYTPTPIDEKISQELELYKRNLEAQYND